MQVVSLTMHETYAAALFDVKSPDGTVTLRVGPAHVDLPPSMQARRLTVVTAFNPGSARPTEAENRRANDRLRAAICEAGWSYWPAVGRSESGDHAEPSFAVLDIGEEQGTKLGSRFKQACVFYWDGERGSLLWC
jgi:Protein of unknown function (DUF3293)